MVREPWSPWATGSWPGRTTRPSPTAIGPSTRRGTPSGQPSGRQGTPISAGRPSSPRSSLAPCAPRWPSGRTSPRRQSQAEGGARSPRPHPLRLRTLECALRRAGVVSASPHRHLTQDLGRADPAATAAGESGRAPPSPGRPSGTGWQIARGRSTTPAATFSSGSPPGRDGSLGGPPGPGPPARRRRASPRSPGLPRAPWARPPGRAPRA